MNPTTFLRFYLLYILFNIGGWVYFGYLSYYSTNLTTQTCNSYIKEITDAIKIFVGIAMSMTTINILVATKNILKGERLSLSNIFLRRPGNGDYKVKDFIKILGKKAKKDIRNNTQIKKIDLG